ncbi:50S ribosomal protein L22 [Patescibacteria group bacterium]|nr:50S ribosomal protein L22 [Patescibacteria group bacterium]
MEVKASVKHLRLSPTKTRLVLANIRGKKADEAVNILRLAQQRPAKYVQKVLEAAIANATNNFSLLKDSLIVKATMADGGPVLKRMLPRAHGRADVMRKPMTHITVILEGEVDKKAKASKVADKSDIVKASDIKGDTKKVKDMAKSIKSADKAKSGKKAFNFQRKAGER